MTTSIPLQLLQAGQTARIDHLAGADEVVKRLEEMGLREGTEVEMVQPGSPCIVRLGDVKLCFRETELIHVMVCPGEMS
ncbi:MAG: FeoA domain-containing protein [Pirellulaceae bacterium]